MEHLLRRRERINDDLASSIDWTANGTTDGKMPMPGIKIACRAEWKRVAILFSPSYTKSAIGLAIVTKPLPKCGSGLGRLPKDRNKGCS